MVAFSDFLTNNCYSGWIAALIATIGLIFTIVIHIKGDKKARIERSQKRNEFRNLSLNFLVRVFSDYLMSKDNFPISKGRGIDSLIDGYKQEFIKHEPFMTFLEKRKYRKFMSMAHNYNLHWQALTSVKKSNEVIDLMIRDQQDLINQIGWLGKKVGREEEVEKLEKYYK